jgi:F-type H+-transporting ATPase subunit gamma
MAGNTRQILRRRIRGIRETAKVTRAMELIASARMRKAEQRAVNARPYAEELSELMAVTLNQAAVGPEHPFFQRPEEGIAVVVHITTDKGLCGNLNSRLNHVLGDFIVSRRSPVRVVTVGKKGRDFVLRARVNLVADFIELGDSPGISGLRPLCRLITDMFVAGEADHVYLCYPRFVSVITQQPVVEQVLPVGSLDSRRKATRETVFEPEASRILEHLLVRYVEASVYHAYLELVACEYSSRMVAMHGATESATDLAEAMSVELNKSRQSAVTEEICDVSAGIEALAGGGAHG